MVIWFILYAFLICATILDCHSGRIPNLLIGTVLFIGAVWYGNSSCQELFFYGMRLFVLLILFIGLFRIKVLGGGDVKVMVAIGGLVGWNVGIRIIILGFFFAAIVALGKMIRLRILRERMTLFIRYVERIYYARKIVPYPINGKNQNATVRLSLFFLLGTVFYQLGAYL